MSQSDYFVIIIDAVAVLEKHQSHSNFQSTVFIKSVVYLNLNMLIIPAISFGNSDSLFQLIITKNYNPKEILNDIYYSDSGVFFIALIIQQGCLSAAFYVTRLNDLLGSYLSPWLADYKRKYMSDTMPWRRPPYLTFQYGYFYGQIMTIFAIILIYSSTVPIITLTGALYLFIRHGVDSFNILTMHRKELESKSEMLNYILFTGQVILILYQCCILVYFTHNDMNLPAFFVILTILMTLVIWKKTNDEVFDEEKIPSLQMVERATQSLEMSEDSISKWRKEYSHPLLLISASHHAQAYGVEILRRDNWQEFMNDDEINDFLHKIEDEERITYFEGRKSVFGGSLPRGENRQFENSRKNSLEMRPSQNNSEAHANGMNGVDRI